MRILKTAQQSGQIPIDEVALYGAQIHVVVPSAETYQEAIRARLTSAGFQVRSSDWIAPTLEDVFISSVNRQGKE